MYKRAIYLHIRPLHKLGFFHLEGKELRRALSEYKFSVLSSILETPIKPEAIQYSKSGKPYLKNYPNFVFNVSHSKTHYALALSDSVETIGLDIETKNRLVKEAHWAKILSPKEWSLKEQGVDPIVFWTQKEGFLKLLGRGIWVRLAEVSFFPSVIDKAGLIKAAFNNLSCYALPLNFDNQVGLMFYIGARIDKWIWC